MVYVNHEAGDGIHFNEVHRFFDLSPDPFAIIGVDGYFKRLNVAWEKTLGYSNDHLLSTPVLDFIHPDDTASTLAELEKLVDGRSSVTYENRYRHQNGSYCWLEWTSHFYDQDGLIYAVARDFTDRREAEEEARRNGEFINLVIGNLPVILHALDKNGEIILSEGKALQLLGVEPGQLVGQSAFETGIIGHKLSADLPSILDGESVHTINKHDNLYFAHYFQPFRNTVGEVDGVIGVAVDVTEQVLISETVQSEQKNLLEFINAFPGLTVVTDLEGNLVNYNEQFAQRYSKAGTELASQNIFDLLSPRNSQQRRGQVQTVIDTRQSLRFQSESPDGYFDVTLFPIFDADQNIVRIGSFVQDVTELKKTTDALIESEARFRQMADATPIMIWMSHADSNCYYLNQSWLQFRGRILEQETGIGWVEGIHADDKANGIQIYRDAIKERSPFEVEFRLQRADGEYRWVISLGWPRFTANGEFVGYIGSTIDIHDRKVAEITLRRSQEHIRLIIENLPIVLFAFDAQGIVTISDGKGLKVLGYDPGAAVGKSVFDLYQHDPEALGYFQRALKGESFTTTRTFPNITMVAFYEPILNSGGNVEGVIGINIDLTEQVMTHRALEQSEKTLREFLNASPDIAFLTDTDGHFLLVNQKTVERYGKTADELLKLSVYDVVTPDLAKRSKQRTDEIIGSRQPQQFEHIRDGRYFDNIIHPIMNDEGEVVSLAHYAHDVTYIKQAEVALRRSERTLRDLLNGSQDIAFLSDPNGALVIFNTRFAELFGKPPEELTDSNYYDLLPPDAALARHASAAKAIESGSDVREEIELLGRIWDYTVHPIVDEHGQIVSLARFAHDITHRKRTEQKLRESEQQFRSVLESAAEGILLTDATGAILLVNKQIENQFGYSRDELFGRSIDMLLPDDKREPRAAVRSAYAKQPEARLMGQGREVYSQRRDGTQFPAEVSLSYIERPNNETLILAFVTDITERKQIEQARLDNQRIQLELLKEREIIELRQRFMAMVSHEFRTPLTIISSSTEMLQHYYDRLSRERQMEKLQVINGQVHSMVALLDDILALNKIQAGAGDFAPEPLDLHGLCVRMLDNIKLVDREQHQFVFNADHIQPVVQADRRMLEHIINNLLSNAVKYSPPNTSIHFLLTQEDDAIRLEVRDTGIGIAPEDQEHLFEPFYRARNAHSINGTGLGLAIVKHNVEKHGGTIACHSSLGEGTTFTVHLPTHTS